MARRRTRRPPRSARAGRGVAVSSGTAARADATARRSDRATQLANRSFDQRLELASADGRHVGRARARRDAIMTRLGDEHSHLRIGIQSLANAFTAQRRQLD